MIIKIYELSYRNNMELSELLKIFFTSGITQMGKVAVDNFIGYLKDNQFDFTNSKCEEIICEYLRRCYEYNAKMNTIVFRGEQKTIFDLYIPLTLVRGGRKNKEELIIDENAIEKIEKYRKIMIVDSAGMGKSTLAKYISVQAIIKDSYIPVVIELRKLSSEKSIWKYMCELFDMLDQSIEYADIKNLIKKGGFLIVFDGYDEIPDDLRQDIINQITEFTIKADKNIYALTSREEDDLCSFGDFMEFKIKPLLPEEAYELIRKYGQNGERAQKLINAIKQEHKNFIVLKEFLVNPLLVSLLYKTYEYKEELPYRKVEFYRQVYEALFNDHDKSKDAYVRPKKCGLPIREFECILRYLAFFSMQKWCLEYESIQELLNDVKDAIEASTGISNVKPDYFVDDLLHAVPLFQKDGGAYRWTHKSFMEYFAAQCICVEMEADIKEELLTKMIQFEKGAKYYNVLDFCYDMDLKIMRKYVLKPFLEKYINKYNEMKKQIEEQGFTLSKEMLDIVTSAEFFLNYKIIYAGKYEIREEPEEDETMQLFDCVNEEFGRGNINMTVAGQCRVIWHTLIKENVYLPRLFAEKNVDIIRMLSRQHFVDKDTEWVAATTGEKGYVDNIFTLLKMKLSNDKIKKLYNFFGNLRSRIYCLDSKKCSEVLKQINTDIAKERQLSKSRFAYLEYK